MVGASAAIALGRCRRPIYHPPAPPVPNREALGQRSIVAAGCCCGIDPAARAAHLHFIDALRNE